jgi:hypothetical protein
LTENTHMLVREIYSVVFAEAMGLDRAEVADVLDAMPDPVQPGLDCVYSEEEARQWLRLLRTDLPGVRRSLADGARTMAARLAAAGMPDPSDDSS